MIKDVSAYRDKLEMWLSLFDLIKVSSADLEFLYGEDVDLDATAELWLGTGTGRVVIVTSGGAGSVAYRKRHDPIKVVGDPVAVRDTVGAGDCYMGALLTHLHRQDVTDSEALTALPNSALEEAMRFAAKVAAINCTRTGCDPPSFAEV